jgi:UDP-4-amino-4,6-dideoxy-N-acetyl-beta-L-altrosamine N-acetyltransferase
MSTPQAITLVPLTSLDTRSQMRIRELRNEDHVRKWMFTDHVIGVNEHLDWISRLKQDDRQIVFAVLDDQQQPLGVISVKAIDRRHKNADWAYYLTESARGGLGSAIEYALFDFVFEVLDLEKLYSEVIEGNDAVVRLHHRFLFRDEGFRRSHIVKDGARIGVQCFGLTREDWRAGRAALREQYQAVFEKFAVTIQWQPPPDGAPDPIDQIEAARARNNLNWMSILRLALEQTPEAARPIVAEIKRIDGEIAALTDKLTEGKR